MCVSVVFVLFCFFFPSSSSGLFFFSNFMVSKFFGFSFAWQFFSEFTLNNDLKKFHSFSQQLLQNSLLEFLFFKIFKS
jgi:hypothetical protein